MDAFEYLSVLVSIVLGLGITQILLGFSRWLEHRDTYKVYAPAIAWAAFLLLLHIQTWWSMFGMRGFATWNFLQFSVVLLQPIVMFLLAVLVFPGATAPQTGGREYFRDQRRWFFGLMIALVLVSLTKDIVRSSLPDGLNLGFHVAFGAIGLAGFVSARERVQYGIAGTALALFAIYIAVLFAEL